MKKIGAYFRLLFEAARIIKLYRNWPEIISNHFRSGAETALLTLRSGVSYQIHPRSTDMGLIREIHSENIYRIEKGDFHSGSVVIDIGAHIGVFSVFAARQAPDVSVYSFEPEPENYSLLMTNIPINRLKNQVHAINEAVSSDSSARKLIRSADSVSAHSFSPAKFADGEVRDSVEVKCTTLAEIFKRFAIDKCDILKLDCEGEEYNILMSAPDSVLQRIKKIVAEYHDGVSAHNHQELASFLTTKGFKIETIKGDSFPTFTVGFLYANKTGQH